MQLRVPRLLPNLLALAPVDSAGQQPPCSLGREPMTIAYSRGASKFDAHPEQRTASDWRSLVKAILADRAPKKGLQYICAPMRANGDGRPHRCAEGAQDRQFLALDLDGCAGAEVFADLRMHLARFQGVGWPTHSSTPEAPRARIVLHLTRPVSRDEGIRVGGAIVADIGEALGDGFQFDRSTHRAEQPVYLPPAGAEPFYLTGDPVDVDAILATLPAGATGGAPQADQAGADAPLWTNDLRERVRSALPFLGDADDRDTWVRWGAAIHHACGGGDDGFGLWCEWARQSNKFDLADARRVWASFGKRGGALVTLGHLLTEARGRGWRDPEIARSEPDPVGLNSGSRSRNRADRELVAASRLLVIRASAIQPQAIRWLWPGRIARGKVTLIAGDPGLGKSTLTANIAAHVTTGRQWPVDGTACEPGSVLLFSAEDDAADTIRPRLDAAGADAGRVHIVQGVEVERGQSTERRLLSLQRDITAMGVALAELGDVRLLVIDPVSAYLDGADSHNNAEVRALLAPLAELASSHGVAIVAVTHLNKSSGGGSAMYRTTGSLAFVAAARAAYVVTRDAGDESRRLFLPLKNNLGPDRSGLAYRITYVSGAPCVQWEAEAVTTTADQALGQQERDDTEPSATDDAEAWLRDALAAGPVRVKDIERGAKEAGHPIGTLQRAKARLRNAGALRAVKIGVRDGAYWCWELTAEGTQMSLKALTEGNQ